MFQTHFSGGISSVGASLTLKHLDCNSGACGGFLNAKRSCFYHLAKRSPSEGVTFNETTDENHDENKH